MTAFDAAAKGAWTGTAEVFDRLHRESKQHFAWRPGRAAMLRAWVAADNPPEFGITAEAYLDWRAEMKAVMRLRGIKPPVPEALIGEIPRYVETVKRVGGANRVRALACAHARFGLELPVQPGDSATFDAWFTPRFGNSIGVSKWMGLDDEIIPCAIRGYRVERDVRKPRSPGVGLIRALDWIWRMGPCNPYEPAPAVEFWPGQEVMT